MTSAQAHALNLRYHIEKLAGPGPVELDGDQEAALLELEALGQRALAIPPRANWLDRFRSPTVPTQNGLYLWGGVGRGKTLLLDAFVEALPTRQKKRVHLHHLLRDVHLELRRLDHQARPLDVMAERIARDVHFLCIDEFHVDDIADAMLLAGLLNALVERGIALVTTSNVRPEDLYKNGLHRERFIPAIELISAHMKVIELAGSHDYRLHLQSVEGRYMLIQEHHTTSELEAIFSGINDAESQRDVTLKINQRPLLARACSDENAWFEFDELCATPRAASDYIEIAKRFRHVLISNITPMSDATADVAQRFVQLIDALYDHRVHTSLSAYAEPDYLYSGRSLAFAFNRTRSRLHEMRSVQYATSLHRVK